MKNILIIFVLFTSIHSVVYTFTQDENDLLAAAETSDVVMVRRILNEKDVNVNICDKYGVTPLMHAVLNRNIYILELLLKNGADTDMKNDSGKTALMYAANRDTNIIRFLVESCADINAQNLDGKTALMYNVLNDADVNKRNNYNKTALTMAEENKNYSMAELLIKYGAVR